MCSSFAIREGSEVHEYFLIFSAANFEPRHPYFHTELGTTVYHCFVFPNLFSPSYPNSSLSITVHLFSIHANTWVCSLSPIFCSITCFGIPPADSLSSLEHPLLFFRFEQSVDWLFICLLSFPFPKLPSCFQQFAAYPSLCLQTNSRLHYHSYFFDPSMQDSFPHLPAYSQVTVVWFHSFGSVNPFLTLSFRQSRPVWQST